MRDLQLTTLTNRACSVLKVLILGLSIISVSGVAHAQGEEKEKPKTKVTQALDNKTYEKIQAAQKAAEEKNYTEAIALLDKLRSAKKLNDFELATVLNIYGYIYLTGEQYAKAQQAYKELVSLPKAPEGLVLQARFTLAQAYYVDDKFAEGVATLKEWFKSTDAPSASAHMLLAQGLYQLKNYDEALVNIDQAVKMYQEKGKVPEENWWALQSFLYYEKGDYKKVAAILQDLLKHYPAKKYWVQLSSMYAELKDERNQLAAYETAYVQGMLDQEQELVNMASLFLSNEMPYKAAKVLDKGIREEKVKPNSKNLELLGASWRQAQEIKKAIPEIARAAALSDKGDLWSQLCGIYLDNDEFKKAVDSCEKGIKKGGLKRTDTTYLYMGMAHFSLKDYEAARKAFKQAAKDKRSKQYADQWIRYMNNELERQRSLENV